MPVGLSKQRGKRNLIPQQGVLKIKCASELRPSNRVSWALAGRGPRECLPWGEARARVAALVQPGTRGRGSSRPVGRRPGWSLPRASPIRCLSLPVFPRPGGWGQGGVHTSLESLPGGPGQESSTERSLTANRRALALPARTPCPAGGRGCSSGNPGSPWSPVNRTLSCGVRLEYSVRAQTCNCAAVSPARPRQNFPGASGAAGLGACLRLVRLTQTACDARTFQLKCKFTFN